MATGLLPELHAALILETHRGGLTSSFNRAKLLSLNLLLRFTWKLELVEGSLPGAEKTWP